jgi:hypothetical protein
MKGNRNALDALQRAIRHTRKRFSAGTPERYPGTPLYGLRLSEAEALAAELERVTAALPSAVSRLRGLADIIDAAGAHEDEGFASWRDEINAVADTLAGGARAAQEDA